MFLPPVEDVQIRVDHIVNTYRGLVSQGKEKFAADPFVIATAEVNRLTVVTEETGPDSLRKIPGVCQPWTYHALIWLIYSTLKIGLWARHGPPETRLADYRNRTMQNFRLHRAQMLLCT
jgi:hypothetical protein